MKYRWIISLAFVVMSPLVFVSFLHADEAAEKAAVWPLPTGYPGR